MTKKRVPTLDELEAYADFSSKTPEQWKQVVEKEAPQLDKVLDKLYAKYGHPPKKS